MDGPTNRQTLKNAGLFFWAQMLS